jgi:hypothetical protein
MLLTAGDRALSAMGKRITHQGAVYEVTRAVRAPFTLKIREVNCRWRYIVCGSWADFSYFKIQFMQQYKWGLLPASFNNIWVTKEGHCTQSTPMVLRNDAEFYIPVSRLTQCSLLPYYVYPPPCLEWVWSAQSCHFYTSRQKRISTKN